MTRVLGQLATAHPYLIGLSYERLGTTDEIAVSETGLYLDELDDLNLNVVQAAAPNKPLLAMMEASRRDALENLEADILAGLETLNGPQVGKYVGTIGGAGDYSGVVDVPDGTRLSMTLQPKAGVSATLVIKRIGLLLAADATVQVRIAGIDTPFTVVATADTPSYFTPAKPIRVPFTGVGAANCQECTSEAIVVSYTVAGFMARGNETSCGCAAMDLRLNNFFANLIHQPANGILLDVEVGASEAQVVVDAYELREAVKKVMGYATRFKAAELLIERIQATSEINRYTMLDREYLWGKRNEFRKNYQDRLNWLISKEGIRADMAENPANKSRQPFMGTIKR